MDESRIIRQTNLTGRVAIDIGANIGNYSKEMAEKAQRVLAIEPHPENIKTFRHRVTERNVELFEGVIGAEDGTRKLYICHDNSGGHTISEQISFRRTWGHTPFSFIEVRSWRLDTLAEGLDVALIKIDVEGAEEEVLRSGEQILRRCKPVLALETHQTIDLKAIDNFLTGLGYSISAPLEMDRHYRCA